MAKVLTDWHRCPASAYALQMGIINGHDKVVLRYLDAKLPLRSDTSIGVVHYDYQTKTWDKSIPEKFQYNI